MSGLCYPGSTPEDLFRFGIRHSRRCAFSLSLIRLFFVRLERGVLRFANGNWVGADENAHGSFRRRTRGEHVL